MKNEGGCEWLIWEGNCLYIEVNE